MPRHQFFYQAAGIRHRDNIGNYGWLDLVSGQVPGNRAGSPLMLNSGEDREFLEYLLNQGADINATDKMNNTLIKMVISSDDNTWANFLIDRGADPTIVVDAGWGDGYDAIQNAIDEKNYPILKKIFNSGVDSKPYLVELASTGFTEFGA